MNYDFPYSGKKQLTLTLSSMDTHKLTEPNQISDIRYLISDINSVSEFAYENGSWKSAYKVGDKGEQGDQE